MASSSETDAIAPVETIRLFDGRTIRHCETWLVGHKYIDPDKVITVVDTVDGAPAIRISGQHWGGLVTKHRYRDYHLVAEFRWGLLTWGSRRERARNSGVLVHSQGRHGNRRADFSSPWMLSVEYEIMEGRTGDMILVPGHFDAGGPEVRPSVRSSINQTPTPVWNPAGTKTVVGRGNIGWSMRDPGHKDVLGFRGANDVEMPPGEWNEVQIICDGDRLTFILNGVIVNKADNCSFTEGKILFQSEGAEIYFRRIELRPVPAGPGMSSKR